MINSLFYFPVKIDRKQLYYHLKNNNIKCKYEPSIHSSVNISYNKGNILIFQNNKILITGVKNYIDLIFNYIFINKLLLKYYNKLLVKNIIYLS